MIEYTKERVENLGKRFKGHTLLQWWLEKIEKANYTDKQSINIRVMTE